MKNTLFYDGNCPVCAREVRWLSHWKDENLELIDIHSDQNAIMDNDFTKRELLSIMHLKTAEGYYLKGLDAIVAAWKHTKYGWLLSPLRWPFIAGFADRVYMAWAKKRACRLGYTSERKA